MVFSNWKLDIIGFSGLGSKKKEVDRYWILIVWLFVGLV